MTPTPLVRLSLAWLALVALVSLLYPVVSHESPFQPMASAITPPSARFPLGTDSLGRDAWVRLAYGGRVTIGASLLATLMTVLLGGAAGLAAAMGQGWVDRFLMWCMNIMLAIPGLLLAMVLVAGMGPGLGTTILAVGIGGMPGFARLARSAMVQARRTGYIVAAEALGATPLWNAFRHLLPNLAGQLTSLATIHFAWAVMGITTLTFLGLAGDPSIPEWGNMLNASRTHLVEAPWLALSPGLAISATILAVHHIGQTIGAGASPRAS